MLFYIKQIDCTICCLDDKIQRTRLVKILLVLLVTCTCITVTCVKVDHEIIGSLSQLQHSKLLNSMVPHCLAPWGRKRLKIHLHKPYFENEIGIIELVDGLLPSVNFIQKHLILNRVTELTCICNGRTAIRSSGPRVAAEPCTEKGLVQRVECRRQPLLTLRCLDWWAPEPEGWVCMEVGMTGEAQGDQETPLPGYAQEVREAWQPSGTSPQRYSPARWCPASLDLSSEAQGLAFALAEIVRFPFICSPSLPGALWVAALPRTLLAVSWRRSGMGPRLELNWYNYPCELNELSQCASIFYFHKLSLKRNVYVL